jgi:purine-nucleoside phosphorylase
MPGPPPECDPAAVAAAAATVGPHDVAVVLGSGWSAAADPLGPGDREWSFTELAGFPPPTAAGHVGRARSLLLGNVRVLLLLGRTHLYEGHGVQPVVHGMHVAAAAGCRAVVLTNAAGGIHPNYDVGEPVLIRDHLNLTARSPLTGAHFVDLTDLYSARLRELVQDVAPGTSEGVYAALPGPHYETPAEIRMLRAMGADLVGMSTALEAIAARSLGMEILGISLVSNPAAGVSDAPLNHAEVLAAGQASAGRIGSLLAHVLPSI